MQNTNTLTSMDLKKVRDELIREEALNKQTIQVRNDKIEKLRGMIESINPEYVEIARARGIYVDNIINVDYERMKTDDDYTLLLQKEIANLVIELKRQLEDLRND